MAEQTHPYHNKQGKAKPQLHKTEVYVLRDFKEYLGESALIIFSVLLALFLTEMINKLHEKQQTKELVANISTELIKNKQTEEDQYIMKRLF